MIKIKTKKQKDQDQKSVQKAVLKCANVLKEFMRDMYDYELNVSWLRIGLINKMFDAAQEFDSMKEREKEEYTFTSYEEDHKHEHWQNSTHISKYE
jgi:hypothetical protein